MTLPSPKSDNLVYIIILLYKYYYLLRHWLALCPDESLSPNIKYSILRKYFLLCVGPPTHLRISSPLTLCLNPFHILPWRYRLFYCSCIYSRLSRYFHYNKHFKLVDSVYLFPVNLSRWHKSMLISSYYLHDYLQTWLTF